MRALITSSFFLLALWFLLGSGGAEVPSAPTAAIDAADIDRAAGREVMRDPPTVRIGGFDQRCQDCHAIFESAEDHSTQMGQHTDIVLDHGLNNRCDNCHDREDRDRLILFGKQTIGFDDVEQLCAKCHGPTYRDWQAGIHGKTRGSWDPSSPEFRRMLCSECHDPHKPAFAPMAPLPPPNTLRMRATDRNPDAHAKEKHNPLRTWSQGPGHAPEPGGSAASGAHGVGSDRDAEGHEAGDPHR